MSLAHSIYHNRRWYSQHAVPLGKFRLMWRIDLYNGYLISKGLFDTHERWCLERMALGTILAAKSKDAYLGRGRGLLCQNTVFWQCVRRGRSKDLTTLAFYVAPSGQHYRPDQQGYTYQDANAYK